MNYETPLPNSAARFGGIYMGCSRHSRRCRSEAWDSKLLGSSCIKCGEGISPAPATVLDESLHPGGQLVSRFSPD